MICIYIAMLKVVNSHQQVNLRAKDILDLVKANDGDCLNPWVGQN